MKFTLALLPAMLGLAAAAPAPEADAAAVEARQIQTLFLTFYGADNDAKYNVAAPADGTPFTISESRLPSSILYPPSSLLFLDSILFSCRCRTSQRPLTHSLPYSPELY